MAVRVIRFVDLPVVARGAVQATEPKVVIRENGQIAFNSLAVKNTFNTPHVIVKVDMDGEFGSFPLKLVLIPANAEQAKSEKDKGNLVVDLKSGEKNSNKGVYFSGAALLRMLQYDYNKSGNHTFDLEMGGKQKNVPLITITQSAYEPAPKRPRKTKETPAAPAAPATPAPAPAVEAQAKGDEDIEL